MLFLAPIIINYSVETDIRASGKRALHEAIRLVGEETGLNVRIGREEKSIDITKVFEEPRTTKTIHIFKATGAPEGKAEVCGSRASVLIDNTDVGSTDLIRHEILHMLGASHYQGFWNSVTRKVLKTIRQCMKKR